MPRVRLALIAAVLLTAAATPALAGGSSASVEAWIVYDLNRARWDPHGYGQEHGVDTAGLLARPPLAPNTLLAASADAKALDMTTLGYFSHDSPPASMWPNEFVRAAGYQLPAWWSDDANYVESIYGGESSPSAASFLGSADSAHRDHLFAQSAFFEQHREIGVGADGENWAIHTGHRDLGLTWATGVAFDDGDGDGIMDLGEGISGVTITLDGDTSVSTRPGGVFSIRITPGSHTLTASGKGFSASGSFTSGSENVGVDFARGVSAAEVRVYALCRGLEPTIIGTEGDDFITGTSGRDIIHGLGGDDVIIGLQGNDVICGGDGDDEISGRGGHDRIYGGAGDDVLLGGGGGDVIHGGAGHDVLRGQAGGDRLEGHGGRDEVKGGSGDDVAIGGRGRDMVFGGKGDDVLKGKGGNDVLRGGPGLDSLNGNRGTDICRAGEVLLNCEA